MPWTRKQVRLLLSKASPLTGEQQDKMKAELHADPSMGHKKLKSESHSYDFRRPKRPVVSRYK